MQKLYVYKAVKNETFDLKIEKKMNWSSEWMKAILNLNWLYFLK